MPHNWRDVKVRGIILSLGRNMLLKPTSSSMLQCALQNSFFFFLSVYIVCVCTHTLKNQLQPLQDFN